MSPGLQTKLLRLVQEGEYKPLGSVVTQKADLRFIAATNHVLEEDIRKKRFREDLYYRLNVIQFELPPLRKRKQDIPLLSYHFLKKYAGINQKDISHIATPAMQALLSLQFPGNVRELENIIERGVIFCNTDTLEMEDLFPDNTRDGLIPDFGPDFFNLPFKEARDKTIQVFHRLYIQSLLKQHNGNISRAAEKAGIQRQYLHRLMKEAGINTGNFRSKGP
jgi:DNA-binding NtrC family response regulator